MSGHHGQGEQGGRGGGKQSGESLIPKRGG